jgi:hypothetical protein
MHIQSWNISAVIVINNEKIQHMYSSLSVNQNDQVKEDEMGM